MEESFYELVEFVENRTSFHLHNYKERPLARRLKVRMRILGLDDYRAYLKFLQDNPKELELLREVLTINLSYFFRNPETFDYLKKELLNEFKNKKDVTFWSAGCAQGEEAYSLAILAAEAGILNQVKIFGSDIDDDVLDKAKTGYYPVSAFQYVPPDILKKYFTPEKTGYSINEPIKSSVKFLHLDLFETPFFGLCDLIMCRNVLIYLDRSGQSMVLGNFYNQMKSEGYLVIGKVELLLGIPEARFFTVVNRAEHVYKKVPEHD